MVTYDAKDPATSFPPIEPLRPPAEAPNVLVVLIDDTGFGASSAFGGPINTPIAERLAAQGLKYNRFHTTALCAPTRAALLTGRTHHSVGMGVITEMATSAPGYRCVLVVFEAVRPFRGVEVRGVVADLVEGDVTAARVAIAGRYLGLEDGERFAADRRSRPGVLLRLVSDGPRVWDLSGILPS